jgi:hypothetical protein
MRTRSLPSRSTARSCHLRDDASQGQPDSVACDSRGATFAPDRIARTYAKVSVPWFFAGRGDPGSRRHHGPTEVVERPVHQRLRLLRIGILHSQLNARSKGTVGGFGPRPPKGDPTHHYHFQIFAVMEMLSLRPLASRESPLAALHGHGVARGELGATFHAQAEAP